MITKKAMRALGQEVDAHLAAQRGGSRRSVGLAVLGVVGDHLKEIGDETGQVYRRLRRACNERSRRRKESSRFTQLILVRVPITS